MVRPLAIIEPDPFSSAAIRKTVEAAGFRADCFFDERSAFDGLNTRPFALAIVDLDRGGFDPFALTAEVSRIVPVLTITSDESEEQCVRALESGADDCVGRSVPDRELVARVRNILRRIDRMEDSEDPNSDLSISLAEMRVRVDGVSHDLTRGEAETLALLLEHAPAPLTTVRIAQLLPAGRGTVESRIRSLRRKLGPRHLVSRGSLGYELR